MNFLKIIKKRKSSNFGHVLRHNRYDFLKLINERKIEGNRGPGRRQTTWWIRFSDTVQKSPVKEMLNWSKTSIISNKFVKKYPVSSINFFQKIAILFILKIKFLDMSYSLQKCP